MNWSSRSRRIAPSDLLDLLHRVAEEEAAKLGTVFAIHAGESDPAREQNDRRERALRRVSLPQRFVELKGVVAIEQRVIDPLYPGLAEMHAFGVECLLDLRRGPARRVERWRDDRVNSGFAKRVLTSDKHGQGSSRKGVDLRLLAFERLEEPPRTLLVACEDVADALDVELA